MTTLTSDKTWRIRLAVVEFVVTLAKHIEKEIFVTRMQQTIVNMLTDSVFAIRDEVTNSLISLAREHYD